MEEWTIEQLNLLLESGELTSYQLTEMYIDRISTIDQNGPSLNSVIELNPDVLSIAKELDAERQQNGPRGPLHGVPVMLKDNIDTADNMTTTAGSLALEGSIAKIDSPMASQLRHAGAIILAKTNLSEWANFRSEHSTSGWSSRGGQTRNPYALDRNPCGSSSGSGVAVAANLCTVAVGTETDGSIVCPSHANGIVGMKPTVGVINQSGIIPISHSQDTAGPMARTVKDAAILLGALVDKQRINIKHPIVNKDYAQFLDPNGLKGARIGVARNFFGYLPDVDNIIEICIRVMKDLGAIVIDETNIDTKDQLEEPEFEVLFYEFKHNLNQYLKNIAQDLPVHSLAELIQFNEANHQRIMPIFGQDRLIKAQAKGSLTEETYLKAVETSRRLSREQGIDAAIKKHQLDAIIAPTGGPAWLTDWVNGDHYGGASSSPAAVAGYPNITVPAGYIHGLPIGISFFAGAFQEPKLLKLAYSFEQATRVRKPPQFLTTTVL